MQGKTPSSWRKTTRKPLKEKGGERGGGTLGEEDAYLLKKNVPCRGGQKKIPAGGVFPSAGGGNIKRAGKKSAT